MSTLSKDERIQLFTSLFRGREDVFAQRWENGGKGGYFPVYADKAKKQYAPLTKSVIEQHLVGNRTVGIYPLLPDNTSWFVVADFDGETWLDSAKRLLERAKEHGLLGYSNALVPVTADICGFSSPLHTLLPKTEKCSCVSSKNPAMLECLIKKRVLIACSRIRIIFPARDLETSSLFLFRVFPANQVTVCFSIPRILNHW